MKVLVIGASNSRHSINKTLATYAAGLVSGAEIEILDLNDFEMPIYSEDREKESGIHQRAMLFFKKIGETDALIISFAEHNGAYTAAFKNIFDWASRIDMKVYQGKPVVMLATSPGPGGAKSLLSSAIGGAEHFSADLKGSLSIPSFYENFDLEKKQLTNAMLLEQLKQILKKL